MRTRTRKIARVNYLGVEGRGDTRTEAKQNAVEQIERAMTARYSPRILHWRGVYAVLYCDRGHYAYALLHPDPDLISPDEDVQHGINCEGTDRNAAIVSIRHHLAQIGWTPADGKTLPFILKGCPETVHADFLSWAQWQLAAHHAKNALGLTGNALHAWACDHQGEF